MRRVQQQHLQQLRQHGRGENEVDQQQRWRRGTLACCRSWSRARCAKAADRGAV
jgi:hypothetical protein